MHTSASLKYSKVPAIAILLSLSHYGFVGSSFYLISVTTTSTEISGTTPISFSALIYGEGNTFLKLSSSSYVSLNGSKIYILSGFYCGASLLKIKK